jgi:transposase
LAGDKRVAADLGAWIVFADDAGQLLRPPKARTWAPRGRTPVVKVAGKGSGRVSLAGMLAIRPGARTRLIFRTITHHGRKNERPGFREKDFAILLDAAHQQLRGPIVLVWDNASHHVDKRMRTFINARSTWLTVYRLSPYAPELNPVEAVWSHLKRPIANLAARTTDDLAHLVKQRLSRMHYRPALLDGFIASTGLSLKPP